MKELMHWSLTDGVPYMWLSVEHGMRYGCFAVMVKNLDTDKKYICYMPAYVMNRGGQNKILVKSDNGIYFLKQRYGLDFEFTSEGYDE